MFLYYQKSGGQENWTPALSSSREHLIQTEKPAFITVLDVSRQVETVEKEDLLTLKYLGPLYFDFDHEDIEFCLTQFQKFVGKLADLDLDLDSLAYYATGGRGFHIEIPMLSFLSKVPKDGLTNLPLIYKEVAYRMFVDCLDLRVYSTKRGRMWRTPNVKRDNDHYKVPITYAEAQALTVDLYRQVTSAPRVRSDGEFEMWGPVLPSLNPPVLSHKLALYVAEAVTKVEDSVKKRKARAKDAAVVAKYRGEFPATVQEIFAGKGLRKDAGWNQIAMQVSILANALGKSHEEVIAAAEPLIESHEGDSSRYGTPAKRREELRLQLVYTQDNPCYVYSIGGIKSLLDKEVIGADLDGVRNQAAIADIEAARGTEDDDDEEAFTGGLVVGRAGIRKRTMEGYKTLSACGMTDVTLQVVLSNDQQVGIEAATYYRERPKGRHLFPVDSFSSATKLSLALSSSAGGMFLGSDNDARFVWESLMYGAENGKDGAGVEYLIREEGLNVVQFSQLAPVPEEAKEPFAVYTTIAGCVYPKHLRNLGLSFKFYGDPNPHGEFQTDIIKAPELEKYSPGQLREFANHLFALNQPKTIATLLGWTVSAHARMFHHNLYREFPLLCIAGEKGTGKSTTAHLVSRLHYYRQAPREVQCVGSTTYGITTVIQASTSVPVILDEYKITEMSHDRANALRSILRAAYNNGTITKGGVNGGPLSSGREVSNKAYSAPLMYLSEVLEPQPAIRERSMSVTLRKSDINGRSGHLEYVQSHTDILSALGRRVIEILLDVTPEDFRASFDPIRRQAEEVLYSNGNYRIVRAYAVTLHGLDILAEAFNSAGLDVSADIAKLKEYLLSKDEIDHVREGVKSEASQLLDAFAIASLSDDLPSDVRPLKNKDYAYSVEGDANLLEISVPLLWTKYSTLCARMSSNRLFSTRDQAQYALLNHAAFYGTGPIVLTSAPGVIRLSIDRLEAAGIEQFKR